MRPRNSVADDGEGREEESTNDPSDHSIPENVGLVLRAHDEAAEAEEDATSHADEGPYQSVVE